MWYVKLFFQKSHFEYGFTVSMDDNQKWVAVMIVD